MTPPPQGPLKENLLPLLVDSWGILEGSCRADAAVFWVKLGL